jgi:hypothetical protein
MTAVQPAPALEGGLADLAELFVGWLETGVRPEGMLGEEVFADLTVPHWRLQAEGVDAVFRLREDSHPFPGRVTVEALDPTSRGFLLKFAERWESEGQTWYSRELVHCLVTDGWVTGLDIYCTGDWDEATQASHARQVSLLRP